MPGQHLLPLVQILVELGLICALLTLCRSTVEPEDGVNATFDHLLGHYFFGRRLYQQESLLHFFVTIDLIKFLFRFVAAETFFEEFGLGIVAGEIDKDPPFGALFLHLVIFGVQSTLFGLKSLHLLLFQIDARLEFFVNLAQTLANLKLSLRLLFHFGSLLLRRLVLVTHA